MVFAALSIFSTLSLATAGFVSAPPSPEVLGGNPDQVVVCKTITTSPFPNAGLVRGLGGIEFTERGQKIFNAIGSSKNGIHTEQIEGMAAKSMAAGLGATGPEFWQLWSPVVFMEDDNGKRTSRLSGWTIQDGAASSVFPYLKADRVRVQRCALEKADH